MPKPQRTQGLVTPDWTSSQLEKPFFLRAVEKEIGGETITLPDRYLVSIETDHQVVLDQADLKTKLEEGKPLAQSLFLQYYQLISNVGALPIISEEWDLGIRPGSNLIVLYSISADVLESLPTNIESQLGLPQADIDIPFKTRELSEKIQKTINVLGQYENELKRLFGKAPGLRLPSQMSKLEQFIPALADLMISNGLSYDENRDYEFIFGIKNDFTPAYIVANDGKCFKPLDDGFDIFAQSPAVSDQRTVKLLNFIDEIARLENHAPRTGSPIAQSSLSLGDFVNKYIYDPPDFDFTSPEPQSEPSSEKVQDEKDDPLPKQPKSYSDYTLKERMYGSDEMKKEFLENFQTAVFVGDNIVGGLDTLAGKVKTVEQWYESVLNKTGIRGLIESALECLGFRGLDAIRAMGDFLKLSAELSDEIKEKIFDIPTNSLPEDFPVVDYLSNAFEQIGLAILESLKSTLIALLIELIQSLLDFCKECALDNIAAGKNRFDGFNFGGLNLNDALGVGVTSFTAAAIGSVQSGIVNANIPLPNGNRTSVAEQQQKVIAETEQAAKNPLLLAGAVEAVDPTGLGPSEADVERAKFARQQELQQQANQAKQEMGNFLNAASAVLTPGEAANMMLGCGASNPAIRAVKNLAKQFPSIAPILVTDEDILDFFKNMGDYIGKSDVLNLVKDVTDNIPEEFVCLCDADDFALRSSLLNQKGMSQDLINEQIDSSNKRREERLRQLNDLLNKENILDGTLPNIYCYVDGQGNVVKGILKNNNPKFDYTVDTTLRMIYDGVASTFNGDVDGFLPTLSIAGTKEVVVPRTVDRTITLKDGTKKQIVTFNNKFLELVNNGVYNYGCLPPLATSNVKVDRGLEKRSFFERALIGLGTSGISEIVNLFQPDPDSQLLNEDFVTVRGDTATTFVNVSWLGATSEIEENYGYEDIDADDPNEVRGMNRPFPESEKLYEQLNSLIAAERGIAGRHDPTDYFTVKYGYSPVPITVKEKGDTEFAPGYQECYQTFCQENRFRIQPYANQAELYRFVVPNNLITNANLDLEQLQLDPGVISPEDNRGVEVPEDVLNSSFEIIKSSLSRIKESEFALDYYSPWNYNEGQEEYIFGITINSQLSGAASSLPINIQRDIVPINEGAMTTFRERNITDLSQEPYEHSPQEKFFTKLIGSCIETGPSLYSVGQKIQNKPDYMNGVVGSGNAVSTAIINPIKQKIYDDKLFDELWRDIFCSFPNQIGSDSNPLFTLDNLYNLNFTPMRIDGDETICAPHLLDIDAVKERVKEEYSLIQCLEASFPNVDGLGSNKDNPFEKANLGGTILLIIRTHVMEVMLRGLQIFYWFRYQSPEDVDDLFVQWLGRSITSDVQKNGYLEEFEKEVLDLYNRNVNSGVDENGNKILENDYDKALKFLIRYQVYSVSNRLSRLVGSRGDTSLDSVLLEEWIPTIDVPYDADDQNRGFLKPEDANAASSDLQYTSDDLLTILFRGELSEYRIRQINGDSALASQFNAYENILYTRPLGQFFREYYGSNYDESGQVVFPREITVVSDTQVWSKESSPSNERTPKLNYGGEDLTNISKNTNFSRLRLESREEGILAASGLMGDTVFGDPSLISDWNFFSGNVFQDPSVFLGQNLRFGISDPEKSGMNTVIRFLAGAARPDLFTDYSVSYEVKNLNAGPSDGDYFYPGWSLRKIQQSSKGKTFEIKKGRGFAEIFGDDYALVGGIPPDNIPEDASLSLAEKSRWWVYDDNFSVYIRRDAKTIEGYDSDGNPEYNDTAEIRWFAPLSDGKFYPWPSPTNPPGTVYPDSVVSGYVIDSMPDALESGTDGGNFRRLPLEVTNNNNVIQYGWTNNFAGDDLQTRRIFNPADRYITVTINGSTQRIGPFKFAPAHNDKLLFDEGRFYEESYYYYSPSRMKDPWTYEGEDLTLTFPDNKKMPMPDGTEKIWAAFGNISTILNPNGTRGTSHLKLFNHALALYEKSEMPYISLMDFDPLSVELILDNEREMAKQWLLLAQQNGDLAQGAKARELIEKYDQWINEWNKARKDFADASPARRRLREQLLESTNLSNRPRREMEIPLTKNYENGGLVLEPYIRVERLDPELYTDNQAALDNSRQVKAKDSYEKDIVNIDRFQDFLNQNLTGGQILTRKKDVVVPPEVQVCGGTLTSQAPNTRSAEPVETGLKLKDFFEKVSLGIRLSYVAPVTGSGTSSYFTELEQDNSQGNEIQFRSFNNEVQNVAVDQEVIQSSKAYVTEDARENNTNVKRLNVIPIVSTEIPFDMNIKISDVGQLYPDVSAVTYTNGVPQENSDRIGFFRAVYKSADGLPFLLEQMSRTDEYKALFKYMFPIDKMLSINNIYASTYISTFPGMDVRFDATKEELKQLLFSLLDSGSYRKSACQPTNRQFLDSLLNGFDIAGLAGQLAITLIKSSVLIFKGFMESADINIILSRRIIDLIHSLNRGIAQAQTLFYQAEQATLETVGAIGDIAEIAGDFALQGGFCSDVLTPGACKVSPVPPRPPDSIFLPIEENFIPEPQLFLVSLALLPATLFAPFAFGPPLTLPYGFIYWGLDYKPSPNWLNSIPPSDFVNELLNRSKSPQEIVNPSTDGQAAFDNCKADLGLPSPTSRAEEINEYYNSLVQSRRSAGTVGNLTTPRTPAETSRARRYLTDRDRRQQQLNLPPGDPNNPFDDN